MRLLAPLARPGEYWVRATRAAVQVHPTAIGSDLQVSLIAMPRHSDVARVPSRTWRCMIIAACCCTPEAGRRRDIGRLYSPVEIDHRDRRQKHPRFSSTRMLQIEVYSGKCTNLTEANGSGIHGYKQFSLTATTAGPRKQTMRAAPAQRRPETVYDACTCTRETKRRRAGRESWMLAALRCAPLGRSASAFSSRWRGAARGCGR